MRCLAVEALVLLWGQELYVVSGLVLLPRVQFHVQFVGRLVR